jgi:DNA invertase Pin-like site-specific DNA recombinase
MHKLPARTKGRAPGGSRSTAEARHGSVGGDGVNPNGKLVRCAIYTRKSTEEGLEQEFNSLDAQREASVAYIASQRHEGWVLSPELYDDGGFSGGNMNRPGLAALMAEVQAGRIQVIVVYKVDRLTRSLADFAKIVEVLDGNGASFVSVTQSFNTTTSMGRLTLNVLLSFAQFEREVTGERIRDKIAASKRKGMWTGGPVPLGYDVQDRKLVVNAEEAETVRAIFQRYLDLGSIVTTIAALDADGVLTKVSKTRDGGTRGGIAWSRGALAHLLANRVYIGEMRHKQQHFPGQHDAIVPRSLWEAVQEQLERNRLNRISETNQRHDHMLAGRLYDGLGRRMQGSQTNRGGRRYHYYVTNPADVDKVPGQTVRVPAPALHGAVLDRLRTFLTSQTMVYDAVNGVRLTQQSASAAIETAAALGARLSEEACLATDLIARADLHDDRLDLQLDLSALLQPHGDVHQPLAHTVSIAMTRVRRGKDVRLVLADDTNVVKSAADPALIKLLATARGAWTAMLAAGDTSLDDVAKAQGYSADYFTHLLRLATLAPCIVQSIVEGRQPIMVTRKHLSRMKNIPIAWDAQRVALSY